MTGKDGRVEGPKLARDGSERRAEPSPACVLRGSMCCRDKGRKGDRPKGDGEPSRRYGPGYYELELSPM